ncbi:hypothetical protein DPMN_098626 [Dreissena polymorpha]|uniref:Uncharacterized protein n=1 Tax=Dreissena polymorpha TaxID=45954 RepID=A0A9D4LFK2_DREPO|nr:hypothetical protein DPMN_098626 [Dreissena polymorpha]
MNRGVISREAGQSWNVLVVKEIELSQFPLVKQPYAGDGTLELNKDNVVVYVF